MWCSRAPSPTSPRRKVSACRWTIAHRWMRRVEVGSAVGRAPSWAQANARVAAPRSGAARTPTASPAEPATRCAEPGAPADGATLQVPAPVHQTAVTRRSTGAANPERPTRPLAVSSTGCRPDKQSEAATGAVQHGVLTPRFVRPRWALRCGRRSYEGDSRVNLHVWGARPGAYWRGYGRARSRPGRQPGPCPERCPGVCSEPDADHGAPRPSGPRRCLSASPSLAVACLSPARRPVLAGEDSALPAQRATARGAAQ